ncbi:MAG: hypothetical protein IJX99_01985 [Clostridia bacterium]|nr:hypothetical protein [Clostridia bacterium]
MMQEKELQELQLICQLLNIPIIDKNRKYWLVRTESGKFFEDFLFNNYIALGWDKIEDINVYSQMPEKERLEEIAKLYEEEKEKRPGAIYNQIMRFTYEMRPGDIVLIPSENSFQIAFGELIDDVVYPYEKKIDFQEESTYPECTYNRRRNVNWIKIVKRDLLDPYLYKLMCSHAAISDACAYSNYIDRTLSPIFVKDDLVHVVYDVTTTANIPATSIISFISSVLSILDVFNTITESSYDKNDIDLRLNVQSPGPIEFIGYATGGGLVLGAISLALFGAKFNLELLGTVKFNIDTKGLAGSILEFIKEKNQNNQEILKSKNDLKKHKEILKAYAPYEERTTPNKKIDENQISIDDITN